MQRASWQEQCPRGAHANPVTWGGRNSSEWSSGLKIAGKHPAQVRKGLGRLPSWVAFLPSVFPVIYLSILDQPLVCKMFMSFGSGKTR